MSEPTKPEPDKSNTCDYCGCYWDIPPHHWGCPTAADDLTRLTEEMGLYE